MPCALHLEKVSTSADFLPPVSPPLPPGVISPELSLAENIQSVMDVFVEANMHHFTGYQKISEDLRVLLEKTQAAGSRRSTASVIRAELSDWEQIASFADLLVQLKDRLEAVVKYLQEWTEVFKTIQRYHGADRDTMRCIHRAQWLLDVTLINLSELETNNLKLKSHLITMIMEACSHADATETAGNGGANDGLTDVKEERKVLGKEDGLAGGKEERKGLRKTAKRMIKAMVRCCKKVVGLQP